MHKNYKAIFLAMFVVVVLVFAGIVFRSARSADVAELNFKRKQLEEQLDSINKKISGLQTQIEGTRKQAASLKNEVLIYDSQIQSTELQIQAKETQIQDTNLLQFSDI
jgi:peptidoglycan hydrolase CwlO-like protein